MEHLKLRDYPYVLDPKNYVEDDIVRDFHELLSHHTSYRPRDTGLIQYPQLIEPVPQHESHLQIIFGILGNVGSVGHWACIYYNNGILRMYDSLSKVLLAGQQDFIRALFPYLDLATIQFPNVQQQNNGIDCGVFAIAFATSLAIQENPTYKNYVEADMRRHLYQMLLDDTLQSFSSTPRRVPGRVPNIFKKTLENENIRRSKDAEKKIKQRRNKAISQMSTDILTQSELEKTIQREISTEEIRESYRKRKLMSRSKEEIAQKERERNKIAKRSQSSNNRRKQHIENNQLRQSDRTKSINKNPQQEANTERHRIARLNSLYKKTEQERNTQCHSIVRLDPLYKKTEQEQNTKNHSEARKIRQESWELVSKEYFNNIKEGYTHPCCCCGRLWHKNAIKKLSKTNIASKFSEEYVTNVFHLNSDEICEFCSTCAKSIVQGQVPRLARANGLVFPDIPEILRKLTPMEERLVSPRHIFIKIVRKGQGLGYQHGLSGNVINVPVQVNNMVTALPRAANDNMVITVELKRRFCYKHGRKEQVRPGIVRQAAEFLSQCELFCEYGIQVNQSWTHPEVTNEEETTKCTCNQNVIDDDMPINPGGSETLLDDNQDTVITMAPGEGQKPISLLFDEHLEELAFIKVHCGVKRNFKVNLSHSEITKSEITRHDRRAVRPDYLFTALKKQQMIAIKNSISTCLRKNTVKGAPVLVANVLDQGFVDNLVQYDEGYRVLNGLRNSPSHWEGEKKKILAMVRQFNVPSIFLTLSAAEVHWSELLVILKKVVDQETITQLESENLSYETKCRLIQSDPFICASYFEIKLREIRKTWNSPAGPFARYKTTHFYYRIEFQHRGSPHAHIMLWLEDAPIFVPGDPSSVHRVVEFIDSIITCSSKDLPENLLRLQTHKHTHTCRPNKDRLCRFGIPFFPMDKTRILLELEKDHTLYKNAKKNAETVQTILQNMPDNIESFNDFMNIIVISVDEYILAICSTLPRPKVILQRNPKDILVNPFCPKVLSLHRANMDVQYILDPFACSVYIVDYINKTDRGMSKLLREAAEEAKKGNNSVRECLRSISNVFLNSSEISAQEAIYCLSGLALSRASEADVYVNTALPHERVHLLKPYRELQQLDPDSTNIFQNNILDYYSSRPTHLENVSLAYFAAYYVYSKRKSNFVDVDVEHSEFDVEDVQSLVNNEQTNCNWIPLQNNLGFIHKRTKPRIIRFRRYNHEEDPDNFYREQLMLYVPWRDEEKELLDSNLDVKDKFNKHADEINAERKQFNQLGDPEQFNTLLLAIKNAEIAQEIEERNERGMCKEPLAEYEFEEQIADVADDLMPGGNPGPNQGGETLAFIAQPPKLSEDDFLMLSRRLNVDQRDVLLHVLHKFCSKDSNAFHIFISGGAGVGKSVLIKTLYQCLTLHFNKEPGSNPDDLKILLTAYTGKAAFGIGGQTIHSSLGLPVSQAGSILPELSPSAANTLATKLAKLRLIIIDEVSMLGSRTFHQVNRRLQQIFHSKEPFAGITVVVVGDLRQLPPVGDNWVFQPNSRNPLADLAGTPLWDLFTVVELNQVMRQRDDSAFAIALNNMADGQMTDDDINLIKSRCFTRSTLPDDAKGTVNLFSSNREVDDYNYRILTSMTTEGATSRAIDIVYGDTSPTMKEKALQTVSRLSTQNTYGLPNNILLKIDAIYMVTVNVDTADGLVNGSTGKLKAIDFAVNKKTGDRRPLRIWIDFQDDNIGVSKRSQALISLKQHLARIKRKWTPLDQVTYTIKRYKSSNLQVRRSQFPIVPAEGITIHKSQGSTLQKVVVHLRPGVRRSMIYVACSRATTAQGLFIVTSESFKAPNAPSQQDVVVKEMQRLRQTPLIPVFRFLRVPLNCVQIIYHNVQSLRSHLPDVLADPVIVSSHILLATETWSSSNDKFDFPGFEEIVRTNGTNKYTANRGCGVAAFVKTGISCSGRHSCQNRDGIGHCEGVSFFVNGIRLIAVYRSPTCTSKNFIDFLKNNFLPDVDVRTLIFGDFNEDFLRSDRTPIRIFLEGNGYTSFLKDCVTTSGGTQLDKVFGNFQGVSVGVYESLFSYHKPLWARIAY